MLFAFMLVTVRTFFMVYAVPGNEKHQSFKSGTIFCHSVLKHIFNKLNCFHSPLSVHSAAV